MVRNMRNLIPMLMAEGVRPEMAVSG
jgi:hypothetical protein